MWQSLSFFRAARHWTRLRLGRVLGLAVVCASFLIVASEARAATQVDYWSTGWISYSGGLTCGVYAENCTAQAACESYRSFAQPNRELTQIVLIDSKTAACWLRDKGQSGLGTAWSSLKRQTDYVSTPPPPTCPSAGQVSQANYYTVTSDSKLGYSLDLCVPVTGTSGGCGFKASGRVGGQNVTTGKWEYQYMGPLTTTGQTCTGNGGGITDPEKDKPRKCDAGMCTGTVNGVEICVRCAQTDTATNTTKTTTNPDGSTTQVTTNTSTTINNNNVTTTTTTTTTTTPAGGGTPTTGTKTETTSETKDSYCQRNPNDAGCKDLDGQASGGDTCDAPPTCTGDAIQCMLVQQSFKTRCELQKADGTVDLGQKLANGQDPMAGQLPTPGKADQVDLSDKLAHVDNMGIQAQCLADLHIALPALPGTNGGSTLNISTGPLCDFGKLFGLLNLLGTTVLCAYMLRGAF